MRSQAAAPSQGSMANKSTVAPNPSTAGRASRKHQLSQLTLVQEVPPALFFHRAKASMKRFAAL